VYLKGTHEIEKKTLCHCSWALRELRGDLTVALVMSLGFRVKSKGRVLHFIREGE